MWLIREVENVESAKFSDFDYYVQFISYSVYIQSVLIAVKYQKCCRTLDIIYVLLFGLGKFNQLTYKFVTYGLATL